MEEIKIKKILLATSAQYGYNTDFFKYVKYIENKKDKYVYRIISIDQGFKKFENNNVIYTTKVKLKINILKKLIELICYWSYVAREIKRFNPDTVFLKDKIGAGIFYKVLSFFYKDINFIFDIRTVYISNDKKKNKKENMALKKRAECFENITIIDDEVAKYLEIQKYKYLPLGSDVYSSSLLAEKEDFKLLYIGIFDCRNIEEFINGYVKFFEESTDDKIELNIVGKYNDIIKQIEFEKYIEDKEKIYNIKYHGFKEHNEIVDLFKKCSIGVAFIPINDMYTLQPPTKTYEYIVNNLMCLATKTKANENILKNINDKFYEIVNDDYDSVSKGLKSIYKKFNYVKVNQKRIDYPDDFLWENIIKKYFEPLL